MSEMIYGTCSTCHDETAAPYPGPPRCRVCDRPRVRRSVRLTSENPEAERPVFALFLEGGEGPMPSVDGMTWEEHEPTVCAWLAGER